MYKFVTLYQTALQDGFALRIYFHWDSLGLIVGTSSYLCNGNITYTFSLPLVLGR